MRVLKLALCAGLLTGVMLAQSSSSSSTSTSTEQQPGQTPTSPLEEPKKPTEAEENKPKQSTFDLGGADTASQDQLIGEIKLMGRVTEINGDFTRSFREGGRNHLGEFNIFTDRRFLVNHRIQLMSMYRGTDDKSIDPENNSLQKAYVRVFSSRDEYIFGDALVNMSRLSFNQNIRGFSGSRRMTDKWKFSAATGLFTDRYGSLFRFLPSEPFTAAVGGVRGELELQRNKTIGFNYSMFRDIVRSLPATTTLVPGDNKIGSIDTKLQFANGLRLESEFAYSFTNFDRRFDSSRLGQCSTRDAVTGVTTLSPCDTRVPQFGYGEQADWGARLEGSWRLDKLSMRGSYVRYQPNFASFNARQISDLQDWVGRVSYDLLDWLTVDGTVRRTNNDLKEQNRSTGGYQTVLWGPEAKLVLHDLGFYRRAMFEAGVRYRDISSSDGFSIDRRILTPFVEATLPIKTMFLNVGFERRQVRDDATIAQNSNTDRGFVGLRGVFDVGNWQVNPALRFEIERLSHRPNQGLSPRDITLVRDYNRLGSAQLFIEAPRWIILEGSFRTSSATITTRDALFDVGGAFLRYEPNPGGYSRPSYRAAVTYKYRNDENTLVIFAFERYSNFYFNSPNYDERIWTGQLVYRFGRRAQ